jgi:2-haloacid dehalogenase
MRPGIAKVRALIFDIGGTVFDWLSAVTDALAAVPPAHRPPGLDPAAFAVAVRAGFLDLYGQVHRRERDWMTADAIYRAALAEAQVRHGLAGLAAADQARLDNAWRAMPAWPDAAPGIAALRRRYVVAPLTILSWPMAVGSSRAAGITWDGILSCDLLGVYKPDPRCFARAVEILDRAPGEIMKVAAHPSDLRAARAAGFRTAYVQPRLEDPGEDYGDTGLATEFDIAATDLAALARQLLAAE